MPVLRLVLLGPPGSGKGTQAARLAERTGAQHISTGELLRAEVAAGSELGGQVAGYLQAGELVPDEVLLQLTLPLVRRAAEGAGYLLDGFPRSVGQAERLTEAAEAAAPERVLLLSVPRAELTRRLLGRAAEQGRPDDTAEVIQRRLEVFDTDTRPLIDYYGRRGMLSRVDGAATPDVVAERVCRALQAPPG